MYIRRIVVEDLRGFPKLDFRFDRSGGMYAGWTVITGDNASGKTALLKSLALALVGPDTARSLQPSLNGWIRHGCRQSIVAVELVGAGEDQFEKGRPYEKPFWSELRFKQNGGPEVSLDVGNKYRGKGKGPTHGPWAENPKGWFTCGYGPFRRLYGASPEAQRVMSGPSRVARFATMFREDATLGECELWLTELKHKELEGRPKETEILRQTLRLLNHDFLRKGMAVDRIDSEGLWLRDEAGTILPLSEMSDGYRSALAMLTDIVRHMVEVYNSSDFLRDNDGQPVVRHPGVVLIDEVDAHLHPEWQRRLGFWFKDRFPNVQFIVTSHSAFICQAADERAIYHLPPPGRGEEPFQIR